MNKKLKKLPDFKSEDEERQFWATHSSEEYFDWDNAVVNPPLPHLKPSTETISLRLPKSLLDRIRMEAKKRDMPYQSFIKTTLYDKFLATPKSSPTKSA